jgi:hypothetical protein
MPHAAGPATGYYSGAQQKRFMRDCARGYGRFTPELT